MSVQQTPVVITVGYSVRGLVEACWQAGFACVAVDHFGDADTREFANDRWIEFQVTEGGLLTKETRNAIHAVASKFLRSGKSAVCVLAGGMENLGGAVAQLREIAPVLGPTEQQRRALRDIEFLNEAAHHAGIQTPQLRFEGVSDSSWLWKPLSSAGGLGIVRSDRAGIDRKSGYWQEFILGEQIGVSCLVSQSTNELLGATRSLDTGDWPGPSEFIYRGSIGPIALSAERQAQIDCLCHYIRNRIGYVGWLQLDFIRDQRGGLWLLECNPRWTAGMEILLFTSGVNPVRELLMSNKLETSNPTVGRGGKLDCFAKAVLYATQPTNLTGELIAEINQIEGLADRPHAPQWIECGHPIATLRAGLKCDQVTWNEVENRTRLLEKLREQAERVRNLLGE